MDEFTNERKKLRFSFPTGQRALVNYKIITTVGEQLHHIYDAGLLDLSEDGAKLQGTLPEDLLLQLKEGQYKLGCNIHLADKIIKTLAILRWVRELVKGEYEFGVALYPSPDMLVEIKRFLIRHQIDTRRLKRNNEKKTDYYY